MAEAHGFHPQELSEDSAGSGKDEFEGWHGQELVVQHIQTNLWEMLRLASFGRRTISIFDKFESSDSWKARLTH